MSPASSLSGTVARLRRDLSALRPESQFAVAGAAGLALWMLWAQHLRQRGLHPKRLAVHLPEWRDGDEMDVLNDTGDVMWREAYCFDVGRIEEPHDAFDILRNYYDDQNAHESFLVMFLRQDNTHICTELFSRGGKAESFVDVNAIVRRATRKGAKAVYVAHNHPSGRLWPSQADDEVTEALDAYLGRAGIALRDHLILARDDFYSSRARKNTREEGGPVRKRAAHGGGPGGPGDRQGGRAGAKLSAPPAALPRPADQPFAQRVAAQSVQDSRHVEARPAVQVRRPDADVVPFGAAERSDRASPEPAAPRGPPRGPAPRPVPRSAASGAASAEPEPSGLPPNLLTRQRGQGSPAHIGS